MFGVILEYSHFWYNIPIKPLFMKILTIRITDMQ